jgi:hypothetical protein
MDILKYDKENRNDAEAFIKVPISVFEDAITSLSHLEKFSSHKSKEGMTQRFGYNSDWLYTACEVSAVASNLWSYVTEEERDQVRNLKENHEPN